MLAWRSRKSKEIVSARRLRTTRARGTHRAGEILHGVLRNRAIKVPVRYRPTAARLKVKHYVSVHLARTQTDWKVWLARLDIDKEVI